MLLVDTSVIVDLLDGSDVTGERLARTDLPLVASVVTAVELEAGIHRDPENAAVLRQRLDRLLEHVSVLPFTIAEARAYGQIISRSGYSRRKVIYRMIGATAMISKATLVTLNPRDFADIPDLQVEDWSQA